MNVKAIFTVHGIRWQTLKLESGFLLPKIDLWPIIQIYIYTCMLYTEYACSVWPNKKKTGKMHLIECLTWNTGIWSMFVQTQGCKISVSLIRLEAWYFFAEIYMPTVTWVNGHKRAKWSLFQNFACVTTYQDCLLLWNNPYSFLTRRFCGCQYK